MDAVPPRQLVTFARCFTAERAEVRHIPVRADQARQALDKAGRLPQRHAGQDLHRQAGLDGSVAVNRMSPTRACRLRHPRHVRIEPDRKRSEALERLVAGGPVQGRAGRCVRSAHPDTPEGGQFGPGQAQGEIRRDGNFRSPPCVRATQTAKSAPPRKLHPAFLQGVRRHPAETSDKVKEFGSRRRSAWQTGQGAVPYAGVDRAADR